MEPPETIYVEDSTVACDGGGVAAGHPKVFLNLTSEGHIDCPYCGRRYVARAAGDADGDGNGGNGNAG